MSYLYPYGAQGAIQLNGYAFSFQATGSGSALAFGQLWNPVGSGKKAVITAIGANSQSATSGYGQVFLVNALQSGTIMTPSFRNPLSPASVMEAVFGAVSLSSTLAEPYFASLVNTYAPLPLMPASDGIVIPPGYGCLVRLTTTSAQLNGFMTWNEEQA